LRIEVSDDPIMIRGRGAVTIVAANEMRLRDGHERIGLLRTLRRRVRLCDRVGADVSVTSPASIAQSSARKINSPSSQTVARY
jgi:hypothetical protein